MYETSSPVPQYQAPAPQVRKLAETTRVFPWKLLILIPIALLVAIAGFITYSYLGSPYDDPLNIRVTNLTSRSASVSWTTKTKTPSMVIYSESKTFLPWVAAGLGKSRAYDDKDVNLAQQEAVQKLKNKSTATQIASITQVKATKLGQYYTHHVTLQSLKPEATYYFMIGNGFRFTDGKGSFAAETESFTVTTANTFKTFKEPEKEFPVPDPTYGAVRYTDMQIFPTDAIFFIKISSLPYSTPLSAVLNDKGNWYIDLSATRNSENGLSLSPYITSNETELAFVQASSTRSGMLQNSMNNDSPWPTVFIDTNTNQSPTSSLTNGQPFNPLVNPIFAADNCCQDPTWDGYGLCCDSLGGKTPSGAQCKQTFANGWKACNERHECNIEGCKKTETAKPVCDNDTSCDEGEDPTCPPCNNSKPAPTPLPGQERGANNPINNCCDETDWFGGARCCNDPKNKQPNEDPTCTKSWVQGYTACSLKECGVCGKIVTKPSDVAKMGQRTNCTGPTTDKPTCLNGEYCGPDSAGGCHCQFNREGTQGEPCEDIPSSAYCECSTQSENAAMDPECTIQSDNAHTTGDDGIINMPDPAKNGTACTSNIIRDGTGNFRGGKCCDGMCDVTDEECTESHSATLSECLGIPNGIICTNGTGRCIANKCINRRSMGGYSASFDACGGQAEHSVCYTSDNPLRGEQTDGICCKTDNSLTCKKDCNPSPPTSTGGEGEACNAGGTCNDNSLTCIQGSPAGDTCCPKGPQDKVLTIAYIDTSSGTPTCAIGGNYNHPPYKGKCSPSLVNMGPFCCKAGQYVWVAGPLGNPDNSGCYDALSPKECSGFANGVVYMAGGLCTKPAGAVCTCPTLLACYCAIPQKSTRNPGLAPQIAKPTLAAEKSTYLLSSEAITVSPKEDGVYTVIIPGEETLTNVKMQEGNKYFFYTDKNANDKYDPGEEIKPTRTTEVTIEKTKELFAYELSSGYNFVSFPFMPEKVDSYDFLQEINKGSNTLIYSIARFTSGSYDVTEYRKDLQMAAGDHFPIVPGWGYIIKVQDETQIQLLGEPTANPVPINFPTGGWYLVGINGTKKAYTAESLIDSIDKVNGLDANNITKWGTSQSRYTGLQKEPDNSGKQQVYGFDFNIMHNVAYFVRIAEGEGTWTPER